MGDATVGSGGASLCMHSVTCARLSEHGTQVQKRCGPFPSVALIAHTERQISELQCIDDNLQQHLSARKQLRSENRSE